MNLFTDITLELLNAGVELLLNNVQTNADGQTAAAQEAKLADLQSVVDENKNRLISTKASNEKIFNKVNGDLQLAKSQFDKNRQNFDSALKKTKQLQLFLNELKVQ